MAIIEFNKNHLSEKIGALINNLELVTKRLKIQSVGKTSNKRKLVISTNLLNIFGFTEHTLVSESVINEGTNKGMIITKCPTGDKKVYGRNYQNRDRETLMDIRHQSKLDAAFSGATHVHIRFECGVLTLEPDYNVSQRVLNEGVEFNLGSENGVYHGIVDALNLIKEKAFESITVHAASNFHETQEYTLFCLQLRRLGYNLSVTNDNTMNATLTGSPIVKTNKIEITNIPISTEGVSVNKKNVLSTFVACTGGVDIACLESDGYNVESALEWAPPEARDYKKKILQDGTIEIKHNDKTEFGAISAAINAKQIKALFNEDFYHFDYDRVSGSIEKANLLHISLQCCDFSSLKTKADRIKAITNLDSTRDMIFPAMALVEKSNTPTVLFENVKNFFNSIECKLLAARLLKLGYSVYKKVLDAKDYNGYARRERCYLFATKLGGSFKFPESEPRTVNAWNDIVINNFDELRDVSHTKSVAKGITTGRLRPFKEGDHIAPTLTRSQSRQCKDSLYVEHNGGYHLPSNSLVKKLMGIPSTFNISPFNSETGSEILGQSICFKMHSALCRSIKDHIMGFVGQVVPKTKAPLPSFEPSQLALAF